MPVELELEAYTERELKMPLFTGGLARGILLQVLRRSEPEISHRLHEPNTRKAYSVTPLLFKSRSSLKDGYLLDPTYPLRMRVRFLEDGYAANLMRGFEVDTSLTLHESVFHVASMRIRSKSYSELLSESNPVDSFRLLFKTPTCFSALGRRYLHLFPEVIYVFGGLLELWSLFSHDTGVDCGTRDEYVKWIVDSAGVSGFELVTRQVLIGRRSSIGFTGWVNYRLGEGDKWRKLTVALARFAEFSNVGKNRTAGLGVTRYLEKRGTDPTRSDSRGPDLSR